MFLYSFPQQQMVHFHIHNTLAKVILNLAGNFSQGSIAIAGLKEKYPNMPPLISCGLMYWHFIFDSRSLEKELRSLVP